MSVKLVTYDLNTPGQKHDKVLAEIKSYSDWKQLSESSYAVDTNLTPLQMWNGFKGFIDGNDRLLIITLSKPYEGWAPQELHTWLNSRL